MSILLAIIALSVLVFFHELGHFCSAKLSGVKVEEFGIGYPPRLFGLSKKDNKFLFFWGKKVPKDSKNTIYSLNLIPFGGFNQLKGEVGGKEKDSFSAQKWQKKAFVSLAGGLSNIILAFLVFSLCFFSGTPQLPEEEGGKIIKKEEIKVVMVMPSSPAAKAGIKLGDLILSLNNKPISSVDEVLEEVHKHKGEEIVLTLKRKEEILEKKVKVLSQKEIYPGLEEEKGAIGITPAKVAIVRYPFFQSLAKGLKTTIFLSWQLILGISLFFKSVFLGKAAVLKEVVGPVGMTALISQAAFAGFAYFLQLLGILSLALGLCQLIPFPALDGFRVLTSLIEGLRKKPLKPEFEAVAINLGFFFLVSLMIIITAKEIIGFF